MGSKDVFMNLSGFRHRGRIIQIRAEAVLKVRLPQLLFVFTP